MKFTKLSVSKKTIMETAHSIAKIGVKKFGGNYSVAFSSALKYVYSVINLKVKKQNHSNLRARGFNFLKATFENGVLTIENNGQTNTKETESDIMQAYLSLSAYCLRNNV